MTGWNLEPGCDLFNNKLYSKKFSKRELFYQSIGYFLEQGFNMIKSSDDLSDKYVNPKGVELFVRKDQLLMMLSFPNEY